MTANGSPRAAVLVVGAVLALASTLGVVGSGRSARETERWVDEQGLEATGDVALTTARRLATRFGSEVTLSVRTERRLGERPYAWARRHGYAWRGLPRVMGEVDQHAPWPEAEGATWHTRDGDWTRLTVRRREGESRAHFVDRYDEAVQLMSAELPPDPR
jgi:hypothetical protein